MSIKVQGKSSGNIVEVNTYDEIKVALENNVDTRPGNVGAVKFFSEVDSGTKTGTPYLTSPEVDDDYRLRTSNDTILDTETFNYTAQNTGKHSYANTTMTMTWGTGGITTNGGNVTTTTIGARFKTYAEFPVLGSFSLYSEFEGGFSAQPVANAVIDFGMFREGGANPFTPTDGVFFRLSAAGISGVIVNNTVETTTSTFDFTYTNAQKYQFIIVVTQREVEFWIDSVLYGKIETPTAQGQPFMSSTLPVAVRHAHVGTASGVINFILNNYTVTVGGQAYAEQMGTRGNAVFGSYQGISGGTMGQLVSGTVTTGSLVKPSAVVPSNTALTAGLCNSLGGRSWETYTSPIGTNVDAIMAIYLNPAGTISVAGRRLKITGVKMSGTVQTVIAGGAFVQEWYLIFGGTAISLQTAESATGKPCRRVMLPGFTQVITANQAVNTIIAQPTTTEIFPEPVYVNPGEYVGLAKNWFGTAPTSGVAAYTIQFIYAWE